MISFQFQRVPIKDYIYMTVMWDSTDSTYKKHEKWSHNLDKIVIRMTYDSLFHNLIRRWIYATNATEK